MIFAGLFQFSYAMDIKAKNTRFSLFLPVDFCLQKMEREPLYLVSSYRKPIVLFLIASDVEQRQYKNDSIQSKIIPTLKLPLFFTTKTVREKARQFQNWNYF